MKPPFAIRYPSGLGPAQRYITLILLITTMCTPSIWAEWHSLQPTSQGPMQVEFNPNLFTKFCVGGPVEEESNVHDICEDITNGTEMVTTLVASSTTEPSVTASIMGITASTVLTATPLNPGSSPTLQSSNSSEQSNETESTFPVPTTPFTTKIIASVSEMPTLEDSDDVFLKLQKFRNYLITYGFLESSTTVHNLESINSSVFDLYKRCEEPANPLATAVPVQITTADDLLFNEKYIAAKMENDSFVDVAIVGNSQKAIGRHMGQLQKQFKEEHWGVHTEPTEEETTASDSTLASTSHVETTTVLPSTRNDTPENVQKINLASALKSDYEEDDTELIKETSFRARPILQTPLHPPQVPFSPSFLGGHVRNEQKHKNNPFDFKPEVNFFSGVNEDMEVLKQKYPQGFWRPGPPRHPNRNIPPRPSKDAQRLLVNRPRPQAQAKNNIPAFPISTSTREPEMRLNNDTLLTPIPFNSPEPDDQSNGYIQPNNPPNRRGRPESRPSRNIPPLPIHIVIDDDKQAQQDQDEAHVQVQFHPLTVKRRGLRYRNRRQPLSPDYLEEIIKEEHKRKGIPLHRHHIQEHNLVM